MSQDRAHRRRRLADELGTYCDGGLDRRLDERDALDATVPDDAQSDRAALPTLGDATRGVADA